jgi:hypothetical protein
MNVYHEIKFDSVLDELEKESPFITAIKKEQNM